MLERNRHDPAAARAHLVGARDPIDRPVAAFHENVRPAGVDQALRRLLVEPGHCVDAGERRYDREPVLQDVERPVRAFAEAPGGGIAVERDQKRRAQLPRPRQVGDMAAVQDVENPVGEDERARQSAEPGLQAGRRVDL